MVFWARGGARRLQRKGYRAVEEVGRDAWAASASRRWPLGQPRVAAALNSGGDRRSREAGWRWKKMDCFAISEISKDPNVNKK